MRLLLDNDIVHKLAAVDIAEDALRAVGASLTESFVLPEAPFVLHTKKQMSRGRRKFGEDVHERMVRLVGQLRPIPDEPPLDILAALVDEFNIDQGEAVLFAIAANDPEARVATGDKRSVAALSRSSACVEVVDRIGGRIYCLEQLIVAAIKSTHEWEEIRSRILPGISCDTALRAVFGSGEMCTRQNAIDGLENYVAELRRETGGLLAE